MSRSPRNRPDGLDYETFRRRIKERDLAPLYLLLGEEVYLKDKALGLLYETIDESARPFNLTRLSIGSESPSGAKTTAAMVIDAANQLPMMSARRIVVVRDFEKIKEGEQELVLGYLNRPSPTTTLVFQAVTLDQRKKLTAALMKSCTVVVFEKLSEGQARTWAEKQLKAMGTRIQARALDLLIRTAGTQLATLTNELEKLSTWAGNEEITSEAVEALVPRAREHTSWELWDTIVQSDRRRALMLLERLLNDGDSGTPLLIVGALASLYRRMLAGKELLLKGASPGDVSRATGQYGNRASAFNSWLARTPRELIVGGLQRIAEVDNAIKNSEGTPRLQMQHLIVALTRSAGPGVGEAKPTSRLR